MFLVYKNRFNEVKPYSVEIIAENDEYIDIFDKNEEKVKTFKKTNILSKNENFEEAINKAEGLQENFEPIEQRRIPSRDNWNNREEKFEVCFTGFPKSDKEELQNFAKEKEMFVRTKVTKNLGLLVCGKTAGWRKLKDANKLNIPRVVGKSGFYNFLETGEFSE
ncbi:MAG: hypothetical protein ACJ0GK_00735 [Gammaproteobacteria bacterium]